MRPGQLHFLRRMKEDLRGHDNEPLFKPRYAETLRVVLSGDELAGYDAVLEYVDTWYGVSTHVASPGEQSVVDPAAGARMIAFVNSSD